MSNFRKASLLEILLHYTLFFVFERLPGGQNLINHTPQCKKLFLNPRRHIAIFKRPLKSRPVRYGAFAIIGWYSC